MISTASGSRGTSSIPRPAWPSEPNPCSTATAIRSGGADNTDDLFDDFVNPGFSFDAVQWLFDERKIDGVGSDAHGPDAATDESFDATYATLLNDGVALVALANLDSVSVRKDVIMASTVDLSDGSGFSTDPIACHGKKNKKHGDDDD